MSFDKLQANVVCPADDVFGLSWQQSGDAVRRLRLHPGQAAHGDDALPAPGLLFLLADNAVGHGCFQVIRANELIVTSSLHIELHDRPFEAHPELTAILGRGHRYHGGVASTALLTAADATVASASGRFAVLQASNLATGNVRPTAASAPRPEPAPRAPGVPNSDLVAAPIHETLGSRLLALGPGELTMSFTARPELANERQGIHGGCGALMGERACAALVRSIADDDMEFRPISMSAAFFRPIAADGGTIECVARVEHAGRTLVAMQAVVETQSGKPAVVVDVVAAGVLR